MKQAFLHEHLRTERSGDLAAACNISENMISIVFYDMTMKRRYSRSVSYGTNITASAALEEFTSLFVSAVMEFGCGGDISKVGIAARFGVESCLEENITCAGLGIPDDSEILFVPFISAGIGGGFTASLLTIPNEDYIAAELGRTLYAAKKKGSKLVCAAFPMSGAFDGSGLESGMPAEEGAIDAIMLDKDGTISYEVIGDCESSGVSPCAAAMAAVIMKRRGVLDADGIMTDRDLFYVGEDFFVSQSDIRSIQADKAGAAAVFEVMFDEKVRDMSEYTQLKIYLSGEIFSDARGLKSLEELGALPTGLTGTAFCRNSAEQGIIMFLEDEKMREKAEKIARSAMDITEAVRESYDKSYFEHLSF